MHWGYELVKSDLFFVHVKMSYHNCGRKEKVTRYYIKNKEVLKENANNKYRNLFEEEKVVKREYGRNR